MSQAPEGLYQLPDGVNQNWNGSHWVPGPEAGALTAAEPIADTPRRWSWSDYSFASGWRRDRS